MRHRKASRRARVFAARMDSFFQSAKPDLVIISADWLEYARPPRFDGMIADLKQTIARLNASGIAVALLGPPAQFRSRLPAMLMRAQLRGAELRTDDFVLPVFSRWTPGCARRCRRAKNSLMCRWSARSARRGNVH